MTTPAGRRASGHSDHELAAKPEPGTGDSSGRNADGRCHTGTEPDEFQLFHILKKTHLPFKREVLVGRDIDHIWSPDLKRSIS